MLHTQHQKKVFYKDVSLHAHLSYMRTKQSFFTSIYIQMFKKVSENKKIPIIKFIWRAAEKLFFLLYFIVFDTLISSQ